MRKGKGGQRKGKRGGGREVERGREIEGERERLTTTRRAEILQRNLLVTGN